MGLTARILLGIDEPSVFGGWRAAEVMRDAISRFVRNLMMEEVRRVVAETVRTGSLLSLERATAQILATYPRCGLDANLVSEELVMTAAASGVAVEFGSHPKVNGCHKQRRSAARKRNAISEAHAGGLNTSDQTPLTPANPSNL
jgi:hypothetical protein